MAWTAPTNVATGDVLTATRYNNEVVANTLDLRSYFRVLQVVAGTSATQTSATTTTYVNSTLTATITPSNTANKVLVIVTQPCSTSASGLILGMRLVQTIAAADTVISTWGNALYNSAGGIYGTFARVSLVSPASIAAVSFRTQMASTTNAATVYTQTGAETSTMILAEIQA